MSQTKCISLLAGAAVTLSLGSVAAADTLGVADGGLSRDEVRSIVAEALADSDARSSLLQSGNAGHDGSKFFIAGGDFRLNIGGFMQFRYLANFRDDGGRGEDDFDGGFQTRRTRLKFNGHVFDNLKFFIQSEFSRNGGVHGLLDAYGEYDFGNGWNFRWGQFKLPFLREELISATKQLTVDRSVTNAAFSQGRSQGVQLGYNEEDWRFNVAFSDGFGSINSDFTTDKGTNGATLLGSGESDWSFTGRFEYKFAGTWKQFQDFTSASGSDYAAMLGAAVHYEGGDDSTSLFSAGDYTYFAWTVDLSVEGDGWNFFAAFIGASTDYEGFIATGSDFDTDDFGVVVQGGVMIPDTEWEVFGRYDVLFPDDDERTFDDNFNTLTFGLNYYMHGQAAKFSVDFQWHLDSEADTETAVTSTGSAFLGDDDDNEVSLRAQFQLLF